ncbi:hypothetical protein F9C07_2133655 [Aspergillus flavus]|uniref:Uncharacterized protein n=1 Tax=Aspergillus flavus (strain ATCC 200026 / FGSC A1120 / IAM 13836 / NRRL 3357 / JCM 12722 / SRRC 167) TaxID=332952 RepID=A0A7U2MNE1_ASPFN|nr:hypothetical protein F9C07_2133655 [Aspergillus flavus]
MLSASGISIGFRKCFVVPSTRRSTHVGFGLGIRRRFPRTHPGIVLFSGEASSNGTWPAEDDYLARIIEVLGQFPLHSIEKGNRATHLFDKHGRLSWPRLIFDNPSILAQAPYAMYESNRTVMQ